MSLFENKCPYCSSNSIKMNYDGSTEVFYDNFKDEQGNVHHHDENDRIQEYTCQNQNCQKSFTVNIVPCSPCCYKPCEFNKQKLVVTIDL